MPQFKIGDKVLKNHDTWTPSDFDRWDAGVGEGVIVDMPDEETADVRWPTGREYRAIKELLTKPTHNA